MLFVILPEVKTFCWFFSLRRGTFCIAVFYIVLTSYNLLINVLGKEASSCYNGANNEKCSFYPVWDYLRNVQLFVFLSALIVSGTLIFGVYNKNHKFVTLFMYVVTIMIVVDFLIDAYIFWIADPLPHCALQSEIRKACITAEIILKILFFYMLIVVKSYRTTLIKRRNPLQSWRSALTLVARKVSRNRGRSRAARERDNRVNKNVNRIIGTFSEPSGSTSRPHENGTPTNEKKSEEDNQSSVGNAENNRRTVESAKNNQSSVESAEDGNREDLSKT